MVEVSVCFPFRLVDRHRSRVARWVMERYRQLLPDYELCVGEPDPAAPFNRSQGINRAFRDSQGKIIIISDLDVMFDPDQVRAAVERVREEDTWGFSFSHYYTTKEEMGRQIIRREPSDPVASVGINEHNCDAWHEEVQSGNMIISRPNFHAVGGFDEDFIGWGYEDMAFTAAADFLVAPHFRIPGQIIHIWHPRPMTTDEIMNHVTRNKNLFETRYSGDLTKLRKWV